PPTYDPRTHSTSGTRTDADRPRGPERDVRPQVCRNHRRRFGRRAAGPRPLAGAGRDEDGPGLPVQRHPPRGPGRRPPEGGPEGRRAGLPADPGRRHGEDVPGAGGGPRPDRPAHQGSPAPEVQGPGGPSNPAGGGPAEAPSTGLSATGLARSSGGAYDRAQGP